MSLAPAEGIDHGDAHEGDTVALNLCEESESVKSIDVSPDGDEALNAGVSVVAIVICAPTWCPYHEQSSTCGEEGFVDALDGATYESTPEEVLPEIG